MIVLVIDPHRGNLIDWIFRTYPASGYSGSYDIHTSCKEEVVRASLKFVCYSIIPGWSPMTCESLGEDEMG
jgi:hypothetical protein